MEQLTSTLRENQAALDALLGVGRNYDVISRDIRIGQRPGRLYVCLLYTSPSPRD